MSAPILWIVLPMIFSLILFIFNKNTLLIHLIQSGICLLILVSAGASRFEVLENSPFYVFEISNEMNVLGRSLIVSSGLKTALMLFYGTLGIWSLFMFFSKKKSKIAPLGLAFVALLIAALAVEPFLYSALIIEIAVIASVPMVANISGLKIRGVSRYLIYFTIGMSFVLLAGWYLAGGEITPVNDEQLIQAALLLGLGFVLWLAVFPFHSWLPVLAEEIDNYDGFFILTILPVAVMILLLKYLNGFAWLRGYDLVFQALRVFGLLMLILGTIWFFFQQNLRKAMSYLMLMSTGLVLIAISLNSSNGYRIATYLMLLKIICFTMGTFCLFLIEDDNKESDFSSLVGLFHVMPLLTSGLILSLLTLIGMPLTAGFPVVQSLMSEFAVYQPHQLFILVLSMVINTITVLRWVIIFSRNEDKIIERIFPNSLKLFLYLGMVLMGVIGFLPNLIFPTVSRIVSDLLFLVQ